MMKYEFDVSYVIDDGGVATYYAWRSSDFDKDGVPLPRALKGQGETPLDAIIDLCYQIQENEPF